MQEQDFTTPRLFNH